MGAYREAHRRSLADRDAFWREKAALIEWQTPFSSVLDYSRPPFARWFVGGRTNLAHNALDRHLAARGDQAALVYLSTETGQTARYTYRELHAEVNRCAAVLRELGVGRGDRVLVYMPMIPEAVFAMLACARLGAVHSVVFGGFAAASLATRIDDATPKVLFTADAGMRGGKVVPYKHLVDEAVRLAKQPPKDVVIVEPRTRHGLSARGGPRPRLRRVARRDTSTRRCRARGSNRASRRTSSTRRAPPASRRACSATPAAMRSRSPRRCATCSTSRRARRCSRPATSAGWSATRTSSTGRCSTGRRRSCTRACRSGPIRRSGGRSSRSTTCARCSARPRRSAC